VRVAALRRRTADSAIGNAADVNGTTISRPGHAELPTVPELVLNGAGERTMLLFRIYAIALYLPVRAKSLQDAIAIKGPKRLHIGDSAQRDHLETGPRSRACANGRRHAAGGNGGDECRARRRRPIIQAERVITGWDDHPRFRPGAGHRHPRHGVAKARRFPARTSTTRCCGSGSAIARELPDAA
jgi:hypothetical protein